MPTVVGSARWVAAQRARESRRTDRLFFDPSAHALSGQEGMAALQLSEKFAAIAENSPRRHLLGLFALVQCCDAFWDFSACGWSSERLEVHR